MRFQFMSALLLAPMLSAQPPAVPSPQPQSSVPKARRIVVNVVVTDRNHQPIHDLKQQNFSLFEDGAAQTILSFEEHKAPAGGKTVVTSQDVPMPPGTFSNFNPVSSDVALNILLLDRLNTVGVRDTFVRDQLLDYLKDAQPGVAIFGLNHRLSMLGGFASDPAVLRADILNQSDRAHAPTGDLATELQSFLGMGNMVEPSIRAKQTLDALNELAHYLATFPGRKNLIWLSGSFPIEVLTEIGNPSRPPATRLSDSEREYRDTMNLLIASQIALYPVVDRGITDLKIHIGGRLTADTTSEDKTILRMAERAGGRAYLEPEGLFGTVHNAIDDGSNYYTLTYSPSENPTDGLLQPIFVKTDQKDVLLEYPRGYYSALPLPAATVAGSGDLQLTSREMAHGIPPSGDIVFKARVLPTAESVTTATRRYAVDFAVLGSDLAYPMTPDGQRRFQVEFFTVAYRADGTAANRAAHQLAGTLTPDQSDKLRKNGLPYHQEIDIPNQGEFSIKLGVHDLTSNRVGTFELPVAAVKDLPPASSVPTAP